MDNTSSIYVLAILTGLLIFILAYGTLMPKRTDRFSPNNENEASENGALRVLTILSSEIHDALPQSARNKPVSDHKLARIKDLLIRSGNPWGVTPEEFAFMRYVTGLIGAISGVAVWFAMFIFGLWLPWYAVVAASALIGFFYPYINHKEKADERDRKSTRLNSSHWE